MDTFRINDGIKSKLQFEIKTCMNLGSCLQYKKNYKNKNDSTYYT